MNEPAYLDDPLREQFAELERQEAAQRRADRQARCPHHRTVGVDYCGGAGFRICEDCGATLPAHA